MKFLSGTRNRSITYTVEASRPFQDMTTGRYTFTPPLRAKFKDHKFDSESPDMQAMYADYVRQVSTKDNPVTVEEVRKRVEEHLINHPDFGRGDGRGLFLDNSATLTDQELRAKGVRRRCIFMQDIGDETVQCQDYVDDPESDYCPAHEAVMVAATTAAKE